MAMDDIITRHDVLDKLDDVCRAKCPHDSWLRFEHCDNCLLGAAIVAVEDMYVPKGNSDGTEAVER